MPRPDAARFSLLAICENAPSVELSGATGSTLISTHVLAHLPTDIALTVAYFGDRGNTVDPRVVERADRTVELPVLPLALGKAMQPFTTLPSASWIRSRAATRRAVRALADDVDVVYLHGLHTFALAPDLRCPIVGHEVDPYADHFLQLASVHRGPKRWYWATQAERVERIERTIGPRADRLVLVSQADADRLGGRLGISIAAIPNGAPPVLGPRTAQDVEDLTVVFGGSLGYIPNVEAVERLARSIMPIVWTELPECRLILTGRRPSPRVTSLASDRIEIRPDVPSLMYEFRAAAVSCFPGTIGLGSKNCVRESLAAGCPVVCSPESARGLPDPDVVERAESDEELAAKVVQLLRDPRRREERGERGRRCAAEQPSWPMVAEQFAELFRRAAAIRS